MTTAQRVGLCALAAIALAWAGLRAQDGPTRLTKGRVLILKNQRVLEGEIEFTGEQYHIRQKGGEMWLPAASARCLCADWDDAFARFSRQANLNDPDERVRLAHWCEYNGLLALAAKEAAAAVRLQPEHSGAKRLLARLEKAATTQAAPPAPAEAPEGPAPAVDLSAESLALFSNRVQPILMNTCASCHATGRGGKFKLARCYDATVNHRALHHNLAAVLAYVDLDEPALSPLLYKAVSAHGDARHAPLTNREAVPFQTLQEWVDLVIASNPHLRKVMGYAKRARPEPVFGSSKVPAPTRAADAEATPVPGLPAHALPAGSVSTPQTAVPGSAPGMPAPGSIALPAPQTAPTAAMVGQAPAAQAAPAPVAVQTAPRDWCDRWIFNTKLREQP